ncbi:ABC transporter permease [Eubacteriales bacterium OttesenSCG-928-N14]|nr:ABC transporter permease [Eubacteriales bacterium OttesenSCG-928-N14]
MRLTLALARRNMKLYFRDKTSVFFSLLGALIVLLLYILFLSKVQADNIAAQLPMIPRVDIDNLINAWVIGGIISISTLTTALGTLGAMVDDNTKGIIKDFRTAPISRMQLMLSYLISGVLSSVLINCVLFVVAEGYLVFSGGTLLPFVDILKVLGLILLCCTSFTAISAFFVTLTKTPGAFGGLSTITGTLIGFLSGSYMPVGVFPQAVQTIIRAMPFSYSAALFRRIFTRIPASAVFANAPEAFRTEYELFWGIRVEAFGNELSVGTMLLFIALMGLVFFAFSVWRLSKRLK